MSGPYIKRVMRVKIPGSKGIIEFSDLAYAVMVSLDEEMGK